MPRSSSSKSLRHVTFRHKRSCQETRPQFPNNIESVLGEHNELIQCWGNAGPLSSALAQYYASTISTFRACLVTIPQLDIEKINVDIKTSITKLFHARWLIAVIE